MGWHGRGDGGVGLSRGEFGVQISLLDAGEKEELSGLVVALEELDLIGTDSESLCEQLDDGVVGLTFFGGGGDMDFDPVAIGSCDASSGSTGHDFNRECGHILRSVGRGVLDFSGSGGWA